ncbi:DUF975 family protein [Streptococcus sanguinis]|uniref:Integral membrane protein n=1 Tax=Streptococcus sanguinis SK115 TaxID=888810 RepID=F0IAA1_STRSA|nr:DUF975 family protein [Streptococcus sanguinis]EGD31241.1 integral membrane protein [Streptococcus sanguinis SK115]MBZ2053894.1 DUF975 family protein [Streptococcus sanguinis]MCY7011664.1 DUF975 family protein [Streptococcus sanguinis]MCY7033349.1 DUF975 family protein [Streptococcus sanguinis]RSI33857.1 hypothetical protein D8876_10100 [Streptococcus sanguinis]
MNLSNIRAQARTVRSQTRGIFLLFAAPTLVSILSILLSLNDNLRDSIPSLTFSQFIYLLISKNLFPTTIQFILTLLLLSASYTMMRVLRKTKDDVGFSDIGQLFTSKTFTPVFKTVLLKQLLIFLWNIPMFCGSLLAIFNAYKILSISEKIPAHTVVTAQSAAGQQILQYTPGMLLGTLLIFTGLGIAIPQYYAYAQAEFILYDQLEAGSYQGAFYAIRQSRKLMKGYKGKLFMLNLSFIGWNLLARLTYGLLNFIVLPYTATAYILFYEELKKENAISHENNPQAQNSLS